MKYVKITEGEGYIGGDYECWCINPVPFDEITSIEDHDKWLELDDKRVYPDDFTPDELEEYEEPKVRYKIIFEVEIIESTKSDNKGERKE